MTSAEVPSDVQVQAATLGNFAYPLEESKLCEVVYMRDFLSPVQLDIMRPIVEKLRPKLKKDHSFASKRLSCMLPVTSPAYSLWTSREMINNLRSLLRGAEVSPGDFPVEMRSYPVGASMDWHVDDLMYVEPQYELVYTMDNCSDSLTQYRDLNGNVHSIWAQPNSLIIIRADSVPHRVTEVGTGSRTIIKLLYTTTYSKTNLYAEVLDSAPWRR